MSGLPRLPAQQAKTPYSSEVWLSGPSTNGRESHISSEFGTDNFVSLCLRYRCTSAVEVGAAQGRIADRGEAVVPDVEYEISLPDQLRSKAELPRSTAKSRKAGTFKPDDIRFYGSAGKESYVFVDHKEVQTIWKDSYYASDRGAKEIRSILERNFRIAKAMPGCKGWLFTTNDAEFEEFLQNEIHILGADKLLKTEIVR